MSINIDFKRFLPKNLRDTRWGELLEALQSVEEDIKLNKIDTIFSQYNINEATNEELIILAEFLGFNLLTLTGYTSTDYFLQREINTITKRIKNKNSRTGYEYISAIFNLLGDVYASTRLDETLLMIKSEYGTWEGDITTYAPVETLDQEADNILYYDEYGNPVYSAPAQTGLDLVYFGSSAFPILDMSSSNTLITRGLIYDYKHKFIENTKEFMSLNTLKVLKNDVDQMKRKTEIVYYQPFLEIDVKFDQSLVEQDWYTYDQVSKAKQKNVFMQNDALFNVTKAHFGNSSYLDVNSGITDVANQVWSLSGINNPSILSGIIDTQTIQYGTSGILEFNTLISDKQQLEAVTELALFNSNDDIVAYSTFPKIQWDPRMYSSFHVIVEITDEVDPTIKVFQDGTEVSYNSLFDVGTVGYAETEITTTFTVKNASTSTLIIDSIDSADSIFTVDSLSLPVSLSSLQEQDFDVTFTPPSGIVYSGIIDIESNDTTTNPFIFNVTGDRLPFSILRVYDEDDNYLQSILGNYTYDPTYTDRNITSEFTLYNSGITDLTISGIVTSNSGVFYTSGVTLPIDISPNASESITCVFNPLNSELYEETISFYNNSLYDLTYIVNLEGIGLDPYSLLELYYYTNYKPPSTGNFTFQDTYVTEDDQALFTFYNTGVRDLIISGIVFQDSGVMSSSGVTYDSLPITISPGDHEDVKFIFTPDESILYSGLVNILNDSLGLEDYYITLIGSGLTPYATIDIYDDDTILIPDGGSYTFEDGFLSKDRIVEFTIENSGILPLNISSINLSDSGVFSVSGITFPKEIVKDSSDTFYLIYDASGLVYSSGEVFITSDASEPLYSFGIDGSGIPDAARIAIETELGSGILYGGTYIFNDEDVDIIVYSEEEIIVAEETITFVPDGL